MLSDTYYRHRCVGIYALSLRKTVEKTQEHPGPVMDTTSVYVRGEENLRGWRPRRESLIFEHREQLEKLKMIEETEKARHILQVQQKLQDKQRLQRGVAMPTDQELSKLSDEHKAMLAQKYVQLLMRGRGSAGGEEATLTEQLSVDEASSARSSETGSSAYSAQRSPLTQRSSRQPRVLASPPMCVPEVQEKTHVKNNPISRKGYLEFFSEQESVWHKRYVVVKKPYVLIYNSDKDLVERGLINLSGAKVQYSDDRHRTAANTFSICTKHRGILLQARDREVYDWIYAMDPLLAGSIKSQRSAKRKFSS